MSLEKRLLKNKDDCLVKYQQIWIEKEKVLEELRVSAFKVDSIFTSFSKVMASCKNDNFLEDFYNKTLKWLNKTRREILKELVEPKEVVAHGGAFAEIEEDEEEKGWWKKGG